MEGVRIVFRNFTGREGPYNKEGDRSFGVVLPPEVVEPMIDDDWNVKQFKPREDEEEEGEPEFWLPIKIKYAGVRPPRVVLITSRGRTNLSESDLDMLDWADIINVDLIVNPYPWSVQDKTGISAYLQSLYVTIEEDALEKKYAEMDSQ